MRSSRTSVLHERNLRKVRWPTLEQGWSMTKIVLAVTFNHVHLLGRPGLLLRLVAWQGCHWPGPLHHPRGGRRRGPDWRGLSGRSRRRGLRSLLPEEYSDEEEIEEPVFEETEDALGPLPTLELSPDAIFERLGLDGVAAPSDESEGEVEETAEVLPPLEFEDGSEEVGVLPTPSPMKRSRSRPTNAPGSSCTAIRAMSTKFDTTWSSVSNPWVCRTGFSRWLCPQSRRSSSKMASVAR